MATLSTGQYFGEMALVFGGPRSATITASTFCQLYCLGEEKFKLMSEEFPDCMQEVIKVRCANGALEVLWMKHVSPSGEEAVTPCKMTTPRLVGVGAASLLVKTVPHVGQSQFLESDAALCSFVNMHSTF